MTTTTPTTTATLDRRFIVQRDGKDFVLYAGLLDLAHQQGLSGITTDLVQLPTDTNGNVAVVKATVTTSRGAFTGYGDASPANITAPMRSCLLRMAETRAKARALRDAVNVGVAALEELGESVEDAPAAGTVSAAGNLPARIIPASHPSPAVQPATAAQLRAVERLAGSVAAAEALSRQRFNHRLADLSKREASALIDQLKGAASTAA
ncbi:MAG: hypothetical protein NTZ05_13220 [Chloroflexi bacterium]|nr:hypothetical protein [Chloroflexota bacterium]